MKNKVYRLDELCDIKSGKRIPKKMDFVKFETEHPYIRARDIKEGKINTDDLIYLEDDVFQKIKRYIINSGDIAITIVGASVGDTGYASKNVDGYNLTENAVRLTNYKNNVDSKFLHYVLAQKQYHDYMQLIAGAAAQPKLGIYKVKRIKVELPDLKKQERIADILSTNDNLIENNNKRIKLLEQIAENLYKELFVRFRFPGYENTKFVDGIPSDWQILRMSDFCYVTDGTHDTPKPVNDGGVPLVTGKCIKNGFVDFNEPYNISYQDHESISKRSGLQTGDILFSNIGTVGTTCLVNYDREFSVKNVIIFKPDNIKVSNYLYSWLNSDSIQAIFATQTNGASQQFVGLNFMRRFKILVPNANVLDLYSDRIKPIRTEIVKLHDINENLIKQRDMLLPRLMSGRLEV